MNQKKSTQLHPPTRHFSIRVLLSPTPRGARLARLARLLVTEWLRTWDLPHRQSPAPDAESGRGLRLVEAFADRWGVTSAPSLAKSWGPS